MPDVYRQFVDIANKLENHYRDMQDMEFTIENGKLFMLQTRNGKRTAAAALKMAVDLVDEGMLSEDEAVLKVEPKQLDALLHPNFDRQPSRLPRRSPKACPPAPVPPRAVSISPRPLPPRPARQARPSSWCVRKPRRRISRAWTFPKAS